MVPVVRRGIAVVLALARTALAAPIGYLTVLAMAAWAATTARLVQRRSYLPRCAPSTRFDILVPAHDEEAVIGDSLASLCGLDYPPERLQVHVIADHCTDATANIARAAGVDVHEHLTEPRGKGPALQWAIETITVPQLDDGPSAVVVVDADTIVDRGFLRALDERMAQGAVAVQGHYGVRNPGDSTGAGLRAAALALRHHLRPLGRTALGGSSGLYGNGMAFAADVFRQHRWTGQLTEDLELQLELLLDGILVAYAPDARVEAEMPATFAGAQTQNERWERGRLELARAYLPRLVRLVLDPGVRHRLAVVDATIDVLMPPMSVLAAATAGVAAASTVVGPRRARRRSWRLLGLLAFHVGSGLALDRAPWSVYRALARAPAMVLWKLGLWTRMLVRPGKVEWTRTERVRAIEAT